MLRPFRSSKTPTRSTPAPNILAAIGREKQVLGQDLEAIRDLRAALRDPLLNPDNAARLKTQIAEAEGRLGRLQVSGPEGAHVIVDEREQTLPLREPIDVARGPFRVRATFAGKTKELSGDAKAGVVTPLALAFERSGRRGDPATGGAEARIVDHGQDRRHRSMGRRGGQRRSRSRVHARRQ